MIWKLGDSPACADVLNLSQPTPTPLQNSSVLSYLQKRSLKWIGESFDIEPPFSTNPYCASYSCNNRVAAARVNCYIQLFFSQLDVEVVMQPWSVQSLPLTLPHLEKR
eukprot:4602521-Amphidinium_carterae.1